MKRNNLLKKYVCSENMSDEAVYAIYQFLEELVLEFENIEYGRIRRYCRAQRNQQLNNDFMHTDKDPF